MKKKKAKVSIMEIMQEHVTSLYVAIMLLIFPLFYRNNYIDILRAKRDFYFTVTFFFLGMMVLLALFAILERGKGNSPFTKKLNIKSALFLFLLLAVVIWLIGGFGSGHLADAFWGETGRYLGIMVYLSGAAVMLILARFLKWSTFLTWAFLLGVSGVYLLQILNEWQIDILGMKENLATDQYSIFIGTIGNLNFNAAFNSITVAALMVLFLNSKEKISMWIYAIVLFLGFTGSFCCRSDSTFLGIGASFLVILGYVFLQKKKLDKVWIEGAVFLLALGVTALFYTLFRKNAYTFDGVMQVALNGKLLTVMAAFLVLCALVWRWVKDKDKLYLWLGRVYWGILLICALAFFTVFGMANIGKAGETGWLAKFRYNDAWGSNRGYVWSRSWQLFFKLSPEKKVFGCGINCYSYLMNEHFGEEARALYMAKYIDAHNEYLQMLVTTGIAGFIGYFGMILTVLAKSVRSVAKDERALLGIVGIAAFLAQGIANSSQITILPFVFIGLGIYLSILRKSQ